MLSVLYLSVSVHLACLSATFHFTTSASVSGPVSPYCHKDDMSALLQFKNSFTIAPSSALDPSFPSLRPKVESWKLVSNNQTSSNCCLWDGVECDEQAGRVVALDLSSSNLFGSINSSSSLFRLIRLQRLNLAFNHFNNSHIPSGFGLLSGLTHLNLSSSFFSGQVPPDILPLTGLVLLDLSNNPFTPQNLSSLSWLWKLTNLETLYLRDTSLQGEIPSSIGNLSRLGILDLGDNRLDGPIPPELLNLRQLKKLLLDDNEISGHIPSWLSKMTQLTFINLQFNRLQGPVPLWIIELPNLTSLHLCFNQLNGTEDADFSDLSSTSSALPKLSSLGLASCNLREFPTFLQKHPNLELLDLNSNNIHGQVPQWMQNIGINSLQFLNLSHNFLTGFDPALEVLPWINLHVFDISSNMFTGPPPRPFSFANFDTYLVPQNKLTGPFPHWICNLSSLVTLDLSFNNLTGTLPECFGNISRSVSVLNLQWNRFSGNIPQFHVSGMQLKMIGLGHNQLQGQLPRSLANCSTLEFIDLGNNQINDTFPSWLESLPQLKVLILSHNKFHGVIGTPGSPHGFKRLRIIDLSYNMFTGKLPDGYFQTWTSMKVIDPAAEKATYLQARCHYGFYDFYMILMSKGNHQFYPRVLDIFTAIDLSGNMFSGEIPNSIGDLHQLHLLNVSNNFLTGAIPSSIGDLGELESLDLSGNELSGEIPQELAELNFLSILNVSYNNLTGPIPRGPQFNTFTKSSFEGNPGLCGDVISKNCSNSDGAETPAEEQEDSPWFLDFGWEIVLMGYGSGLVIGIIIENALNTGKQAKFTAFIRGWLQKRERQTRRTRRN